MSLNGIIDTTSAYRQLQAAIVVRAIRDYVEGLTYIRKMAKKKGPLSKFQIDKLKEHKRNVSDCEVFFQSDWFCQLTDYKYDGVDLMNKLKDSLNHANGRKYINSLLKEEEGK